MTTTNLSSAATPQPQRPPMEAFDPLWSENLLDAFVERMAAQGYMVNFLRMGGDLRYALQRLCLARVSPDRNLRLLAVEMMLHLERRHACKTHPVSLSGMSA